MSFGNMFPDNLLAQFMKKVNALFRRNKSFSILGYNISPTNSKKVMRISVFIAKDGYDRNEDNYAWARELGNYLEGRFPDLADSHSSIVQLCPHCSQRPRQGS